MRLRPALVPALALAAALLTGCAASPTPAATSPTGSQGERTGSARTQDDGLAVPKSGLVFKDEAAEQLYDAINAAATGTASGWLHLPRSYGGGNTAGEKWCSPEVFENDCRRGRLVPAPGVRKVEHDIWTYDSELPMTVEYQTLSVDRFATAAGGWNTQAYLDQSRFFALMTQGGDDVTGRLVLSDTAEYTLAGLPQGSRIDNGQLRLETEETPLQQLHAWMVSADELRTRQLKRLDELQRRVNAKITARDFTICDYAPALHAGSALAQPAPPCIDRAITAADVASIQKDADNAFASQREQVTQHYREIYAALVAAFPWGELPAR